jgi:hypothetical protein
LKHLQLPIFKHPLNPCSFRNGGTKFYTHTQQ